MIRMLRSLTAGRVTRPAAVRSLASSLLSLTLATGAAVLLASPAGAQQLVDAGKEGDGSGGLAFVLFAILVFAIGLSLFYMDRVRRRRSDEERTSVN
jgi:hypothetical protein